MTDLLALSLQLFADGGATGDGGDAAGSDAGNDATGDQLLAKYGMTTDSPAAGGDDADRDAAGDGDGDDLDAAFEEMVKGKYKGVYGKRVEETIRKRLTAANSRIKQANDRISAYEPLMELLGAKYGVSDASDVNAVIKAIEDDNSFFEEAASEKGMTVEEYKAMRAIERENTALKKWRAEKTAEENRDRQYVKWFWQAEDTKKAYPDFDLQAELQNPQFAELLQNTNITVRGAYEAVHHSEMMEAAVKRTSARTKDSVAKAIIAGAKRPAENGLMRSPAASGVTSVANMTTKERHELIARAARGEKIRF